MNFCIRYTQVKMEHKMNRKLTLLLLLLVVSLLATVSVSAQDEFVFGVILVGPDDDRGWSQSHFEAGQYVEANFEGARMISFESLNPADSPETTLMDVVEIMVSEGAQVIFTTSDSFEEDTNVVAAAYPDVVFINITGSNVLAEDVPANIGNFNGRMEMPRMLAGCSAALTTQTGKIGYLGALINPETRRLAASSYLGARYCYENFRGMNPDDLVFEVVWIGFWFNIPGVTLDPTEVATNFFDSGADVIISGIDTTEAITVAGSYEGEVPTYAIPYGNINGCSEAPDACLGAAFYNWGPAYLDVIEAVAAGTWEQSWDFIAPVWDEVSEEGFYMGADTSVIGFVMGDGLSEENRATLAEFGATIAEFQNAEENAESFFLWQGPLNLQDGTVLAEEGEAVEILDIWFLPQLLEGMLGASTSE
jgi:simple sugar transport system substrate-binding protein